MIRKEFIHLRRNPNVVAFTIGLPITLVLLFGYALRLKVDHLPVAVWDQEQTFFSTSVTDRLRRGTQFRLIEANSEDQIRAMLRVGEARIGLIIPKGFSNRIVDHTQTEFPLFVDGTMPTVALSALQGMSVITSDEAAEELQFDDPDHPAPPLRKPPIKLIQDILFNPELRDSDFFLPGTIGIATMIVLFNLSLGLVREKEQQTIEQLLVTPISRFAVVVGKLIPYAIFGGIDFLVVALLSVWVFDLPFRGPLLATAALALIFMAACLAQGALVAALTASEQVAQFVLALIVVPSILMTGLVFPLEAIPRWLRPVAWVLPMTYFTNAMRGFTLKGAGVADHAIDFLALAGFTVILSGLSLAWFRKQSA
jgi:ABC-type multidrug transport system permease subunit